MVCHKSPSPSTAESTIELRLIGCGVINARNDDIYERCRRMMMLRESNSYTNQPKAEEFESNGPPSPPCRICIGRHSGCSHVKRRRNASDGPASSSNKEATSLSSLVAHGQALQIKAVTADFFDNDTQLLLTLLILDILSLSRIGKRSR